MAQAPYDLSIGETVAGYRIDKLIGRGGSATVYEARKVEPPDPRLAGSVAFKVMHEHDPSGIGKQRFAREAALSQKLEHPHVVRLLDYGYTDREWPFIVFELLRGLSLKAAIRQRGPFDVPTTARFTLEILAALAAAHELGIIHRDIKPANVFLHRTEQGEAVRVLDLGLAKALFGDGVEVQTLTGTGYRLGTPRYMSPEMARGQKVGLAGDLYAVALLMAEMITGQPVVRGQSQVELLLAHSEDTPLPLDEEVCRSPFHGVILRGLAKDVQVRYHTAMQMRADVEAALMLHERLPDLAAAQAAFAPDMAPTMVYGGSESRVDSDLAAEDGLGSTLELSGEVLPTLSMSAANSSEASTERLRVGAFPAERDPLAATLSDDGSYAAPLSYQPPREKSHLWLVVALLVVAAAFVAAGYFLAG